MGLSAQQVPLSDVARSGTARLDSRYHEFHALVAPTFDGMTGARPLGSILTALRNGANVAATNYADSRAEAVAYYLSVASVSSGVLEIGQTTPLADSPAIATLLVADQGLREGDLVITRSGTPGICWPFISGADQPLVAAGFMFRASCVDRETALYLAAILNHPVWRVLTRGLSAGKRQDNISQTALRSLPIPWPIQTVRSAIAADYEVTLGQISTAFAEAETFNLACDRLLSPYVGFPPEVPSGQLWSRAVAPREIAAAGLRLDGRWHGLANQRTRDAVTQPVPLGRVLAGPPRRGRQPIPVHDEAGGEELPLCIATADVQQGQIVWADVKPTDQPASGVRVLRSGEIVIAMDGVGSLGKAAVVDRGPEARTICHDSHVGAVRIDSDTATHAVCCFLNSSWGRRQTEGLMTGATGQTQLAGADLGRVLVPKAVLDEAGAISDAFQGALQAWEPPKIRSRALLASNGSATSERLVAAGALGETTDRDTQAMQRLLQLLY